MSAVTSLSYWRVVPAPAWPRVVGQGAMPAGPVVSVTAPDGSPHDLALTWGQLLRASSSCDPDRGVANLDAEPVALARCAVIRQLRNAGFVEAVDDAPPADALPDAPAAV